MFFGYTFLRKVQPAFVQFVRPWYIYGASFILVLAGVLTLCSGYSRYAGIRDALTTKEYQIVAGRVMDYVPQKLEDHHPESFTVGGHRYSFYFWDDTAGYTQTQGTGSPIREGEQVRIADVDGQVARLEIVR